LFQSTHSKGIQALMATLGCSSLLLISAMAWAQADEAASEPPTAPTEAPGDTPGDEASLVAASVQRFYDQTQNVSASFYQTYVNRLYKRTDRSKGRVVFKKPGQMRWDYDKPNGKVIASDGKRVVIYEPADEGERGQVIEQPITQAQLPQALAFLMGTGRLQEDFTFRLLDPAKEGYSGGHVLELRPRADTPHYARLLFYVEKRAALRGLVRRLLIIDHNGNRNRFDFSAMKFNKSAPETLFRYQPPAGARRVQM